jgi:hypothetical protein
MAVAVAVPLLPPLQDTSVPVAVADRLQPGSCTVTIQIAVQPFRSVTVTV